MLQVIPASTGAGARGARSSAARARVPVLLAPLLCAGCAGLVAEPPPVDLLPGAAPELASGAQAARPLTGALFDGARYRSAFEDRRARQVGDLVTIVITEQVAASQKSSSTLDRQARTSAGLSALPFAGKQLTDRLALGASSENAFSGKGGTESANNFSATITATVIEVLANGHLVVSGEKQIGVNQNVDVLRFCATVDPQDLLPGSAIASTRVANLRLLARARGAQGQIQEMGWLARWFNRAAPF